MELSNLFPVAVDLAINLPDGSPTDIKFKVVGQDSKAFRDVAKRYAQQFMGSEDRPSIDVLEQQNSELVAACIVGWSGLTEGGEPLVYSKEKAVELMLNAELAFLREQVETHVAKRANFFCTNKDPA